MAIRHQPDVRPDDPDGDSAHRATAQWRFRNVNRKKRRSANLLNWMFTWLGTDNRFTRAQMAPIATQLFLSGNIGLEVAPQKRAPKP
ncbi:hypothetical protein [Variovorax sp. E3]|uniref:hypothetical protein n=1 Tax=Variovorax sp. E3 TaxID=1914993 RepID=UPI0022B63B9D|nr:hypothetical protein [Variovorax sp. E3]